ncbi:MarR family winged helix-turn-helix transcriptional regulator [Sporosarcina trichiuri]|uniref:MarR family winged helix-turn-helix transcriptional regulator n=1 Tax=Sporosarcina trichiuri TaxID=3056445 RepID=UPI0025B338B4|nr:MarR family transcriptional regulator [Sporosarcina sp. 0.2-SM1T-5]WJY28277.1 MarR family transcriptional regulator [Sporosarcina sp. 0.2-SM1T-5]
MHLAHQFFRSYIKLYRPVVNQVNKLLARYDLHTAQWTVLSLLSREGEMTSAEIAEYQMIEKPSVAKNVKRLHELGHLDVTPGEDKREKRLKLSGDGETLVQEILSELQPLYDELLAGIPKEDIERAVGLLDETYANLMN